MTDEEIIHELSIRWVTREEICVMLGLPDRAARAYIEDLSKKLEVLNLCILSTSGRAGYHIPNREDKDDVALAEGVLQELKSKAISIFERRKPIENFLRNAERQDIQLTLF